MRALAAGAALLAACSQPVARPALWEAPAPAPAWALAGNGARPEGPDGDGLYAVGVATNLRGLPEDDLRVQATADRSARELMALVTHRLWLRGLGLVARETGAYGLYRTVEAAPCREALAAAPWRVTRRWRHPTGRRLFTLAFLPRATVVERLTACPGCAEHPLCRLLSERVDEVLTDYAAWSEAHWDSVRVTPAWVQRASGPFADGPAGRGFYGVGRMPAPSDALIGLVDLQHRAQLALRDALLLFVSQATGTADAPSLMQLTSASVVPPCVSAVEHLQGELIEIQRHPANGFAIAALAFLPAARVRAALRDCDGCQEFNICRGMDTRFDELFMAAAKANAQARLPAGAGAGDDQDALEGEDPPP